MAKTSMKNRELKRQQTVAKYAKKRAELKATIANPVSYTHLTLPTKA